MEWTTNEVPLNIGGYKYNADTNTCPIFINYEKAKYISANIDYENRFLNRSQVTFFSKGNRTLESDDVKRMLDAVENQTKVELFVRKNKDDRGAKSFYYLGRVKAEYAQVKQMKKTGKQVVEIIWELDNPVREDMYDYITDND